MTAQIQERVTLPPFTDPVLITSFTNANKGGTTASWALGSLMSEWNATLVAELDAPECYSYGRLRPKFRHKDGNVEIEWPTNLVYAATPEGSERTFLFLVGVEPTVNWQAFAETVSSFALRAGVRTAVSLRASVGSVSHRQTPPVFAIYANEEQRETFGAPVLPMQEGAADIGLVVNRALRSAGCEVVDLFVVEPFYTPPMPHAGSALALLDTLRGAFNFSYEAEMLEEVAQEQSRAFDQLLTSSDELRDSVEAIENITNRLLPEGDALASMAMHIALQEGELDADEVVKDVEDFFRKRPL